MNIADMVQSIYNTVVTTAPEKTYFWTSSPVNIKSIYPDIYNQLTSNDFIVGVTSVRAYTGWNPNDIDITGATSADYNSVTGILSFSSIYADKTYGTTSGNRQHGTIVTNGTTFALWCGTIGGV